MSLLVLLACQDATLSSADDAPTVTILRPANGSGFDPSSPIDLCAQVDDERPPEELALSVESDVDGVLAEGEGLACTGGNVGWNLTLSNTEHHLTVLAIDDAGQVGQASVLVLPEPNEAPACTFASPSVTRSWIRSRVASSTGRAPSSKNLPVFV